MTGCGCNTQPPPPPAGLGCTVTPSLGRKHYGVGDMAGLGAMRSLKRLCDDTAPLPVPQQCAVADKVPLLPGIGVWILGFLIGIVAGVLIHIVRRPSIRALMHLLATQNMPPTDRHCLFFCANRSG